MGGLREEGERDVLGEVEAGVGEGVLLDVGTDVSRESRAGASAAKVSFILLADGEADVRRRRGRRRSRRR